MKRINYTEQMAWEYAKDAGEVVSTTWFANEPRIAAALHLINLALDSMSKEEGNAHLRSAAGYLLAEADAS